MPWLEVFKDGKKLKEFTIDPPEAVVGRDSTADLNLSDALVSRTHARIVEEKGAWWVVDLETANGTFVNGVKEFRKKLVAGDRLGVGPFVLTFRDGHGNDADERAFIQPADRTSEHMDSTRQVSPEEAARIRQEAAIRLGPHLLFLGTKKAFYALTWTGNVVGTGANATIRLPEADKDQAAIIERAPEGGFQVRAPGFFHSVAVNGERTRKAPLKDGDLLHVGRAKFKFNLPQR